MSVQIQITLIHNDPAGKDTKEKLNDEYIVIQNTGTESVNLVNWEVTDWRPGQQHIHKYKFPFYLSDKSTWKFDPGEYIFLMTGHGLDVFVPASNGKPPQFHFYWNKDWFVWNNTGDTACLYDTNGKLVSQLTVP